ncbi:MAG TPA: glycosyltransferase [Candidatus Hydrogenedentes bacterium]|nr:glycosyltransferase [Candidatus Hydrogenedentota bacterium]
MSLSMGIPDEVVSRFLASYMHTRRWIDISHPLTAPAEPLSEYDALFIDARHMAEPALDELLSHEWLSLGIHGALFIFTAPEMFLSDAFWRRQRLLAYESCEVSWNGERARAIMIVRANYNPVRHARELCTQGNPIAGLEVLLKIPERLIGDDGARGLIASEKLSCMLARDNCMGEEGRINRLARALNEFYLAATFLPTYHPAYQTQALFWARIGRGDMARRALRSVLHAAPDTQTQEILDSLPLQPEIKQDEVPIRLWREDEPLRLLYLMPPGPDYGTDVLYHGLCLVLSEKNVAEFPWKPTLHGSIPAAHKDYPCLFEHPGKPLMPEEIIQRLQEKKIDAILLSDVLGALDTGLIQTILQAAKDTPIIVVDMWDQCGDYKKDMEARLGFVARGQFKREMLCGAAYSPNTFPLSFAYPDERIPKQVDFNGRDGMFWAGKAQYGTRRLTLEWLEQTFGFRWQDHFSQTEYTNVLQEAAIGLCLFGNGFDTVRYWEVPAHGAMLLAERPPIHIPENFKDGESAVFFDDLPDLEEKLGFYLQHPDQVRDIAEQGHRHLKTHHAASARARQFLTALHRFL